MTPDPSGAFIRRADLWGLSHYAYGEAYFGSFKGMRYRLARDPLENVSRAPKEEQEKGALLASVWPEPWAYARTPADEVISARFPFSEEGMDAAADWFNEQYTAGQSHWKIS